MVRRPGKPVVEPVKRSGPGAGGRLPTGGHRTRGPVFDSYIGHINDPPDSEPSGVIVSDARTARRHGPVRRALPWIVAGLLLTTVGLPFAAALDSLPSAPMVGHARPLASTVNVTVNLTDRPAFSPSAVTAPAGSMVSIHLANTGNFTHTFTLCAQPDVIVPSSLTPSGLYDFFRTNGSLANVSLAAGDQGWANITFNASVAGPASFEFVSVVPYQFQAGMFGFLNLTSTGPGLALSENTTNAPGFVPDVLAAQPAHYPINLDVLVTNEGSLPHTFTVAPQTNVTLLPSNFTSYFSQHAPLVSANVPAAAGGTIWANFTITGPGVYQYICEIPGHFAAGMYGYLYVGVAPPAAPTPPSTAVVDAWVLGGSATLLGIGVLLALVATYTGRFARRPGAPKEHH